MKHVQLTKPSFVFLKVTLHVDQWKSVVSVTNDLKSKMPVRCLGRKRLKKIKLIDSSIDAQAGDRVHIDCRRILVRPPYVKVSTSVGVSDSTFNVTSRRSQTPKFSPKDNCIFCGQAAKYDGKKKGFDTIPCQNKRFPGLNWKCVQKEK